MKKLIVLGAAALAISACDIPAEEYEPVEVQEVEEDKSNKKDKPNKGKKDK